MEITDPATPRRLYNKPDQESSGGGSVDGRSSANSSSRSFDCTFCKRGFSNAQALGGHMNLHRKDKTRRNCTSPCPQFPFDHVAVAADGIACMSPSSRASKSLGEDEIQEKQGMGMPGVVDAELDLELRLGRR